MTYFRQGWPPQPRSGDSQTVIISYGRQSAAAVVAVVAVRPSTLSQRQPYRGREILGILHDLFRTARRHTVARALFRCCNIIHILINSAFSRRHGSF